MPTVEINSTNFKGVVKNPSVLSNSPFGFAECYGFDPGNYPYLEINTDYGAFVHSPEGMSLASSDLLAAQLTGTLTFTNGSSTVTGSGTAFTTEVGAGMYIRKNNTTGTPWYKVSSVASNTTLTIAGTSYQETTGSGSAGGSQVNIVPTGFYFWHNIGGTITNKLLGVFSNGTIKYMDNSGAWTTIAPYTHSASTRYNPCIITSDNNKVVITNGSTLMKVRYANSKYFANDFQSKYTSIQTLATAVLTWAGTATVTSDIDISATIKPGQWIRRSSTSIYWDEVAFVSVDGLTITLTEASSDTGASSAGAAQYTSAVSITAKYAEFFKGKLFASDGLFNLYWSVSGDTEDMEGEGAGGFVVQGPYGNITGIRAFGDYLFIFRLNAYEVYSWTGDVDAPISQVNVVPHGCYSQLHTTTFSAGIAYLSTGQGMRVANASSDTEIASQFGKFTAFAPTYNANVPYGLSQMHLIYNPYINTLKLVYGERIKSISLNNGIVTESTLYSYISDPNRVENAESFYLPMWYANVPEFFTTSSSSFIGVINPFGKVFYQYGHSGAGSLLTGNCKFYLTSPSISKNISLKKINVFVYALTGGLTGTCTITVMNTKLDTLFSDSTSIIDGIYGVGQSNVPFHPAVQSDVMSIDLAFAFSSQTFLLIDKIAIEYDILDTI